jgi:hypothetical protein
MSFSRVMPGRHCASGFRFMMVSVMFSGAGSVEVSPARSSRRPTRPRHGLDRRVLLARDRERLRQRDRGSVIGMNISRPR